MMGSKKVAAVILGVAIAAGALVGSCAEPVHDIQVKALGGELAGVPTGEFHRAGQPCAACHGGLGPASRKFTLAGTVFNGPVKAIGEENVEIELVDATGSRPRGDIKTNCVGNFFVTQDNWDPAFPILVWMRKGAQLTKMQSHIGREPSCAQCHKDPPSFDTPGHVRLYAEDMPVAENLDCPVNPDLNPREAN